LSQSYTQTARNRRLTHPHPRRRAGNAPRAARNHTKPPPGAPGAASSSPVHPMHGLFEAPEALRALSLIGTLRRRLTLSSTVWPISSIGTRARRSTQTGCDQPPEGHRPTPPTANAIRVNRTFAAVGGWSLTRSPGSPVPGPGRLPPNSGRPRPGPDSR
jgi:hypothetical protein